MLQNYPQDLNGPDLSNEKKIGQGQLEKHILQCIEISENFLDLSDDAREGR